MKKYREIMESWPYRNIQLWKYNFKNININDLLVAKIYAYLKTKPHNPESIHIRKHDNIIYKVHRITHAGYQLIEVDWDNLHKNISDWKNYLKSYPAICHGIIIWNNKIYLIVSTSHDSSSSESMDIINATSSDIKKLITKKI